MLINKQINQLLLCLHFCPHQRAPKAGKVLLYIHKETKSVKKQMSHQEKRTRTLFPLYLVVLSALSSC